jgi:hypothetical protein
MGIDRSQARPDALGLAKPQRQRRTPAGGFVASRGMGAAQGNKVAGRCCGPRDARRSRPAIRSPCERPLMVAGSDKGTEIGYVEPWRFESVGNEFRGAIKGSRSRPRTPSSCPRLEAAATTCPVTERRGRAEIALAWAKTSADRREGPSVKIGERPGPADPDRSVLRHRPRPSAGLVSSQDGRRLTAGVPFIRAEPKAVPPQNAPARRARF